ncbi:MAG: PLP-dependent aminotransferase family protein [Mycobacteriaceae bacterium]
MAATTHPSRPHPALASRPLVGSVIDKSTTLLAGQTHDIVRFAMGAPGDDLIPVDLLDRYMGQPEPGKYAYGATEGEQALVEQIIGHFAPHASGRPDRITVTTGGMQGLDLAFKLFVDPGDLVVVEGPTYTNGSATALAYNAEVVEVPVDGDGLVTDALEDIVAEKGRPPKVIYTIPNFQNPSGVTLSHRRRVRLLELAEQWGSVILDDDPYGELRFDGDPVPSFHEISPDNPLVFSARTFSKTIAPGLRIGWVDADPSLSETLINAKQAMDTCASPAVQLAVTRFLRNGHFAEHRDRVLGLYRERKNAMVAAVERYFGDDAVCTDPDGGFFLWLTLTGSAADVDTQELFEPALADGVVYIPGPAFSPAGLFTDSLRLCFATSDPARIDEGVRRLAATIDRVSGRMGAGEVHV